MAKNSKIEWTHHTLTGRRVLLATALRFRDWFQVNFLVTVLAKRNAVAQFIAKLWKFGERLDVVGVQIAAFIVSAVLASIAIPLKDGGSPIGIFNSPALVQVALVLAVLIGVMAFASGTTLSRDPAQPCLCFGSMRLAGAIRSPQFCSHAHLKLGFYCMGSPFENGRPALCALSDFDTPTLMAFCTKPVVSRTVFAEACAGLPRFAFRAALQALGDQSQELFKRDSRLLC